MIALRIATLDNRRGSCYACRRGSRGERATVRRHARWRRHGQRHGQLSAILHRRRGQPAGAGFRGALRAGGTAPHADALALRAARRARRRAHRADPAQPRGSRRNRESSRALPRAHRALTDQLGAVEALGVSVKDRHRPVRLPRRAATAATCGCAGSSARSAVGLWHELNAGSPARQPLEPHRARDAAHDTEQIPDFVRHHQPPRRRDEPLSAPARAQPGRLVSLGRRGLRERAATEDKPIFLSVGYSTCHWCHVMERESFEDDEIAALMNEHFVTSRSTAKSGPTSTRSTWPRAGADRRRRLADDRVPDARRRSRSSAAPTSRRPTATGMPASRSVLRARSPRPGANERDEIVEQARRQLTARCRATRARRRPRGERSTREPCSTPAAQRFARSSTRSTAASAARRSSRSPMTLDFLLRDYAPAATRTRSTMVADHARRDGRGRHLRPARRRLPPLLGRRRAGSCRTSRRCSTTTRCSRPSYLEAYQITGDARSARVARDTFDYVLRDHARSRPAASLAPRTPTAPSPKGPSVQPRRRLLRLHQGRD